MFKTSVVVNDQHIPFHDKVANKLVFKFIKHMQPTYIDILGDLVDFWQISKFVGDPSRKQTIQEDLDMTKEYLQELRDIAPKSEIVLHYGNHVLRLKKFIWRNASALDSIKSLDMSFLLDLPKLKIQSVEGEEGYVIRGQLVMTHGTVVSQDSGATARRNVQKYGLSVICGHTHRLGAYFKNDLRGIVGGWENGCLCNMSLIREWGREVANWGQGFSIVDFHGDLFRVQQVPIIRNKFMFGREVWSL